MSERWDDSDMVCFVGSRGYALDSELKTWDVGSEQSIQEAFKTGIISPDLCDDGRRQALQIVLDYREEEGYGTGKGNLERDISNGTARSKPKATRRLETRQRLSNRLSFTKNKTLSTR